jgi:hypothetical protein
MTCTANIANFRESQEKSLKFYEPCGRKPKNKISVIYRCENLRYNRAKKASGIG